MENTAKALGLAAVESKEGEEILALLKCARSIGLTLSKQKYCSKISAKRRNYLGNYASTFNVCLLLSISFVERRVDEVVVVCGGKQVAISAESAQARVSGSTSRAIGAHHIFPIAGFR